MPSMPNTMTLGTPRADFGEPQPAKNRKQPATPRAATKWQLAIGMSLQDSQDCAVDPASSGLTV
jgi:hypothetical protein